jgi:hypothetical protein
VRSASIGWERGDRAEEPLSTTIPQSRSTASKNSPPLEAIDPRPRTWSVDGNRLHIPRRHRRTAVLSAGFGREGIGGVIDAIADALAACIAMLVRRERDAVVAFFDPCGPLYSRPRFRLFIPMCASMPDMKHELDAVIPDVQICANGGTKAQALPRPFMAMHYKKTFRICCTKRPRTAFTSFIEANNDAIMMQLVNSEVGDPVYSKPQLSIFFVGAFKSESNWTVINNVL